MHNNDSIHAPETFKVDNFDFEFEPEFDVTNGPDEAERDDSEPSHNEDQHDHNCGPDCDCEDNDHNHDETDEASSSGHTHGPDKNAAFHEDGHEGDGIIQPVNTSPTLQDVFAAQNIFAAWDNFEFTAYNPVSGEFTALDFTAHNIALNVSILTAFNAGQGAITDGMQSALFNMFEFADSTNLITPRADSVPADNTTTATIDINGQVTGTIEDLQDQDFYKVELVAGVTYEFYMLRGGDDPLEDPYLRLFDTDGVTQISENDDIQNAQGEQASRNSKITYTPTESGTYFIAADKWVPPNNGENSGDYTIFVNADGYRPEGTIDELAFFLTDQFDNRATWNQTTITYDVSNLPEAVQTLALAAMQLWEDVTPLDFVASTDATANITFADDQSGAFASTTITNGFITESTINISQTEWVDVHGTEFNSYTFSTYIHEIGHALGLGHGGPYNGNADYGVDNVFSRDLANYSVMSYNDQTPGSDAVFQGTPRLVLGVQIVDLIAIHDLYGTNPDGTRAEATVYGFNSNAGGLFDFSDFNNQGIRTPAISIYDTGGYDTLDLSAYSAPQRISLIAETFSDIGNNTNLGGNVPLINIISIARDTVIEAAIGGSGDDTITGNTADNNLRGELGADTLDGGLGNDTLTGGSGDDIFMIKADSSDVITDFFAGDKVILSAQAVTTFAQLTAAATQTGEDVVITLGDGHTLTLQGVVLSQLSEESFEFTEIGTDEPTPPTPAPPAPPPSDQANPADLINAIDHIYIDFTPFS